MDEEQYQVWLKAMDASCDAMIAAGNVLKRSDMKAEQRMKAHASLVSRSLELKEIAEAIQNSGDTTSSTLE